MKKYTFSDYAFQFVTITAGVLIALGINQLVETRNNEALVREARGMILREIADNRRELENVMNGDDEREKELATTLQYADDWLTKKKSAVTSLQVGSTTAELNSSSWRSAERTGALALMDYAEVKRYTEVYGHQDLFVEFSRRGVELVANALSHLSSNFNQDSPNLRDLEQFRQQVLLLRSHQFVTTQLGKQLIKSYDEILRQ